MSGELIAYLRREAGRAYKLGSADCVTLVADWVCQRRGTDPMASWRGLYDSSGGFAELLGRNWLREFGAGLRSAGCERTRAPVLGDVALVAFNGQACGAIRSTARWVVRLDSGLAPLPPERVRVIAAWRV